MTSHKVATIGGRGHAPSGIGIVKWIWKDDEGNSHEFLIHNTLYFPQSPINILSVTEFARQLDDVEGTGIDTKQLKSRFYWNNNKYSVTIRHPASNLPEMPINEGFSSAQKYAALVNKVINTAISWRYSCCFTKIQDCEDFEDYSTVLTTDIKEELFEEGETLFCAIDGWSGLVKVKSIYMDDANVLRFIVLDSNSKEIITTREHLRSPSNPDVGWIPSSTQEYNAAAESLSDKEVEALCSPLHLSPLQQEFLSLHNRLFHLPFAMMLRLCKFGILPKRFLKLRNNLPPCASCMFGQAHRRPWKHETSAANVGGSIRNPRSAAPGEKFAQIN